MKIRRGEGEQKGKDEGIEREREGQKEKEGEAKEENVLRAREGTLRVFGMKVSTSLEQERKNSGTQIRRMRE